nr:uncharacterized protein A4U43_C03F24020 [Ipomoea batatas]GME21240.1 uncharacterized protein A4U43_C03F24020 [Ipomoea batatas]
MGTRRGAVFVNTLLAKLTAISDDRQLGKPGPTGRPSRRIDRRSGGNVKRKSDSRAEISTSERPCSTGISADLRWWMRFLAYAAYEKQTLLGFGLFAVIYQCQ